MADPMRVPTTEDAARAAYEAFRDGGGRAAGAPPWESAPPWVRGLTADVLFRSEAPPNGRASGR